MIKLLLVKFFYRISWEIKINRKAIASKELFHFLKLAESLPAYMKIPCSEILPDRYLPKHQAWLVCASKRGALAPEELSSWGGTFVICANTPRPLSCKSLQSLRNFSPKTFKISRGKPVKFNGPSVSILNCTF